MAEPIENIYTPQDIDLTIGRDVGSVTSRLPINRTANISTPQGFMDDVGDEFMLNWVGQIFQRNNLKDDFNFSLDIDPLYDPFEKNNLAGYEEYVSEFKEVRNKEHHDFIKAVIDTNLARRNRLETSDGFLRNIGAGLLGNLPDPINFIPIPLVKGMSFAQKAGRGALISMGLVGATEPIRRNLDPTATSQETIGYIASAGLFGGALTGLLGRTGKERSALGNAVSKTIKDKGGINKITEKYFKAHHKTEGRKDFEADGFNYRVGDDAAEAKVEVVKTNKGEGGFERLASYDSQNNVVKINETAIRAKYYKNEHMYSNVDGIVPLAKSEFKTVDDYISFLMKKEINRTLYFRKGQKENPIDYENRLNSLTLAELKDAVSINRQTDLSGPKAIFKVLENFTNFGKIINKQSDPSIAMDAQRLIGDYASSQRAERLGLPPMKSALVEAETKWNAEFIMAKDELDKAFELYRTDKANGKQILGMNMQVGRIKAVDAYENAMQRLNRRQQKDPDKYTQPEFNDKVHDAVIDNDIFNDAGLHPAIKQAAVAVRKFYERYRKDAEELGMFASQGAYNNLILKIDGVIEDLKTDIKTKPLNKFQEKRTKELLSYLQKRRKAVKQIQKELEDGTISPPYTNPEEYINRLFARDKILANPELFKQKLRDHYVKYPFKRVGDKTINYSTDPASINKRVEDTYNRIVDTEANTMDGDSILGYDFNTNGVFKAGVRPLMSRVLDIPTKDVKEFVETDVVALMNNYNQRMSKAVEVARTFGDKHMEIHLYQMERKLIKKQLKSEKDNTKINETLNAFEDAKDTMMGGLSTQDPASFGRRSAQALRDWASLAYMGKVIFSAFPDMARPFMTAGFGKTFNVAFKSHAQNTALYGEALQQIRWMTPIIESQMGSARLRFQETGGQIQGFGKGKFNKVFDKIASGLNKAQGPFYFLNLLTFHTQMWKQIHSMVAAHRFLEDSIKWSKGTASDFDKKRLISFGIDEKNSKTYCTNAI